MMLQATENVAIALHLAGLAKYQSLKPDFVIS